MRSVLPSPIHAKIDYFLADRFIFALERVIRVNTLAGRKEKLGKELGKLMINPNSLNHITSAGFADPHLIDSLLDLEIRYFTQEVSGTMRNFVYGKEVAINGIKILPESTNEPSYIGTAYVNIDDIQLLDERFNNLWNLAKPVEKTPEENKT